MKSPTSLIRFRNAVGVMLALSAIFAVVISAVTITQERALGDDHTTVSITGPAANIEEGDSATVTVTLSGNVPAGASAVVISLTVGADNDTALATDYTVNPDPAQVSITAGNDSGTVSIDTVEDDIAEGQKTVTVSLGSLPEFFTAASTSSVTITIDDDDNTDATGAVTIDIFDSPTSSVPVTNTIPKSGQYLVANISAIDDPDHDDPATPLDEGTTVSADFPVGFSYHWYRVNGTNDTAASVPTDDPADKLVGTGKTYTPGNGDVGAVLYLIVVWSDRYGNGDATPQYLDTSTTLAATAYDQAKPFIIVGALDEDDKRIEPGVVLTRNSSGMSSTLTNDQGNLIDDDGIEVEVDRDGDGEDFTTVSLVQSDPNNRDVEFAWSRAYEEDPDYVLAGTGEHFVEGLVVRVITECDAATGVRTGAPTDEHLCDGATYNLDDDDVGEIIILVAKYEEQGAPLDRIDVYIESEPLGRVYSPNAATGMPEISGVAQVGSTLTAAKGTIADLDNDDDPDLDPVAEADITYEWFHGDAEDDDDPIAKGPSYVLAPSDVGETIKVRASFVDALNDPEMRVSGLTTEVTGSPGEISRIEAAIRGVTVSADDIVTLSVDIYGLQDAKDNTIGATFEWTLKSGESEEDLEGSGREIDFTAPSSPGRYTVTASLGDSECQPETEADRADDCEASITVQVRRPSAPVADPIPPVNPPGEIPGLIPDADGNQYEVFTPVEGGTFDGGEGYSINVPSGAVPNGEYIGIRMSDDGAASNLGMTHQRYTLGGNMYGVHAVDASGAAISSYVLEDPAEVCVPLPASLRTNISGLSLAAINSDGSLTVLAAQVRLDEAGGTMVCGNLSNLPASVAVGAAGAPDAIPTATPVPEPELPPTGGTSPASGSLLWVLLLGAAVVASGTYIVIGRRQKMVRTK